MSANTADQWIDERARALDDEFADVISGHRLEDWLGAPDSEQHVQRGWRPGCYHRLDQWAQHGSQAAALGNRRQGLLTVIGAAWAAADGGATWRETTPWLTMLAAEPDITRRYGLESMLLQWTTASDPQARGSTWQQQIGPLAAVAWAAGMGFHEACDQAAAGALDEDGLITLATLRGYRFP